MKTVQKGSRQQPVRGFWDWLTGGNWGTTGKGG